MKNLLQILHKLLLPSLLCIITTSVFVDNGILLISLFALITSICNLDKTKSGFLKSILYTLIISFIVFGLAILNYILVGFLFDNITPNFINFTISKVDFNYLIQVAFFSPIFMFYGYKFIFKINFTYVTYLIIVVVISILFILGLIQSKQEIKLFFGILEFWQIIMAFALQLILYQKELKVLFKPKNG